MSGRAFPREFQRNVCFGRSSLTPWNGAVSQGRSWCFPPTQERAHAPVLAASGLLWVSYAPLHVRLNLITRDKVLQSRPLKVLYKDAALK